MQASVFTEMLGVIDEAIDLADDAVKAAEAIEQRATQHPVTLVKVASARARNAARVVAKTGVFDNHTVEGLTKIIEEAGPSEILDMMEKLASRAVFAVDAVSALDGDLVEKSTTSRAGDPPPKESRTAMWSRLCEEVGYGPGIG